MLRCEQGTSPAQKWIRIEEVFRKWDILYSKLITDLAQSDVCVFFWQIADFGLSNLYHGDKYLQTFCGSPLYASPEIVNGRPYRGPEVDTWSLGVLLYTMVHGTMPFDGNNHKTLVQQISTGNYRKPNNPSGECLTITSCQRNWNVILFCLHFLWQPFNQLNFNFYCTFGNIL